MPLVLERRAWWDRVAARAYRSGWKDAQSIAARCLHEHLEAAERAIPLQIRARRTAILALRALARQLRLGATFDAAGDPVQLLGDLGIRVSAKTARAAVRLLSTCGVIVRLGRGHFPSRIRLRRAFFAAVAAAEASPITPQIFEAGSSLLGDPVQLSLALANQHRNCDGPRDSSNVLLVAPDPATGAGVAGSCSPIRWPAGPLPKRPQAIELTTVHVFFRDLPARPRIQQAAALVFAHGSRVDPGLRGRPLARALLGAAGQPSSYREVDAIHRAIQAMIAKGWLRDGAGGALEVAADRHPDLVILGIEAQPSAEPSTDRQRAALARMGVWRPELLSKPEAVKLQFALRQRRHAALSTADEPLTLPELRVVLGTQVASSSYPAALARLAGSRLVAQARTLDRGAFSALSRRPALHGALLASAYMTPEHQPHPHRPPRHQAREPRPPEPRIYRLATRRVEQPSRDARRADHEPT